MLAEYVREEDTLRPVTMGSVMPVVGMVSGLAQIIDVFGFNYRTCEYSGAHSEYPDVRITSYNVCYTKLLRPCSFCIDAPVIGISSSNQRS